jgi:hypothetical protein
VVLQLSALSADAGHDGELLVAAAVDRSCWSLRESTSVRGLAPALHTAAALSEPVVHAIRCYVSQSSKVYPVKSSPPPTRGSACRRPRSLNKRRLDPGIAFGTAKS